MKYEVRSVKNDERPARLSHMLKVVLLLALPVVVCGPVSGGGS